jgi:hypothetical protein
VVTRFVREVDGALWVGSLFGRAVGRAQTPAGPQAVRVKKA